MKFNSKYAISLVIVGVLSFYSGKIYTGIQYEEAIKKLVDSSLAIAENSTDSSSTLFLEKFGSDVRVLEILTISKMEGNELTEYIRYLHRSVEDGIPLAQDIINKLNDEKYKEIVSNYIRRAEKVVLNVNP